MSNENDSDTAYIFVGADRSQLLAVPVLEHSIKRHTSMNIKLRSMDDVVLPDPKDIRQGKRTGFSFTRFAIPQLMGYKGRAIYLDADMLVFRDFRELWNLPFNSAKIIIQEELPDQAQHQSKPGALKKRVKQCSVMLLDCEALSGWDPVKIIAGLDGQYTYQDLLYDMCILDESEINYGVPFEWNSLEHYEANKTGLIHWTDMNTQPWVYVNNPTGYLFLEEVRIMLENGSMTMSQIENEVNLGYVRPSIIQELKDAGAGPVRPVTPEQVKRYEAMDSAAGFVKHKAVYEAARARSAAVKAYEAKLAKEKGPAAAVAHAASTGILGTLGSLKRRIMG
ncbi:glycosyltransferase [Rhizobium sp. BK376]|uniref:glycosyltransferase n=1 Tax=Rhizobium sp. BK376 TaxID=2512149 RepID=UPI00104A8161|nr:glycosyltransferase [Rhizobium sp. BK376]TCR82349.1 glycosyl transferase family 8 [Rhizobium sp. BK376]